MDVADEDFFGKKGHFPLRAGGMIDELGYTSGLEVSQEKSRRNKQTMLKYLQTYKHSHTATALSGRDLPKPFSIKHCNIDIKKINMSYKWFSAIVFPFTSTHLDRVRDIRKER
jgi:hypothetical protein